VSIHRWVLAAAAVGAMILLPAMALAGPAPAAEEGKGDAAAAPSDEAGAVSATTEAAEAKAGPAQVAPAGPVRARGFAPMTIRAARLEEKHTPVYFRSPLAEPGPGDRRVDRNVPLASGAAVADWFMFACRALGFPVEMALRPPWQMEWPGRQGGGGTASGTD